MWVDVATFLTVIPLCFVFYFESLTNKLHLRWEVPVLGLSLSPHDYRSEMFKDYTNICAFTVWSCQVLLNIYVVYYHITRPHHPKFYSTWMNKLAMLIHIIGGVIAVNGFYLGVVLNLKEVCIAAAAAGIFLHLPTVVWNNRNTHGQRELSAPSYFMTSVFLTISYVNFVLYDANYQTVFSCAMTTNIYAMVRFYYILNRKNIANVEASYDRMLFLLDFRTFLLHMEYFHVYTLHSDFTYGIFTFVLSSLSRNL